jgi:hypothetical protein
MGAIKKLEKLVSDPVPDPAADQAALSSQEEGILAYMKRPDELGWILYGMRSFMLAMIFAVPFSILCVCLVFKGPTPEIQSQAFNGLQMVTVLTVGWFVIVKKKTM